MGPHQVAVVGCGTAGPACALLLHRGGHAVQVFERIAAPGPVGAGILLQPTGMSVLARLGLLDRVARGGARVDRLYGVTERGRVVLDLAYRDLSPGLFGLGVHRGLLFTCLFDAVRTEGIPMACGVEVEAVRHRADGRSVLIDSAGAEHGPFSLVVVADGARSRLRSASGLERRVQTYPWGALWALAPDREGRFKNVLSQVFRGARRFAGFLPTGHLPSQAQDDPPLVSLFWSLPADELDDCRRRGLPAFRDEVLALAPQAEPILDTIDDIDALTFATYYDVSLSTPYTRNVVYLGDAAHAMSPQLGQGANLALMDALVLAGCLTPGTPLAGALALYEQARRAHVRFYQWTTRLITPFFQSHSAALGFVRDLLFGRLGHIGFFRRRMLETQAGLKTGPITCLPRRVTHAFLRDLPAGILEGAPG